MKIQGKISNSLVAATAKLGCEVDLGKAETPIQRIAGISPWTSSHYQKDIASLQTHPSAAKSLLPSSAVAPRLVANAINVLKWKYIFLVLVMMKLILAV